MVALKKMVKWGSQHKVAKLSILVFASAVVSGCHTDMWYQAKVTPWDQDESGIFKDGASSRPIPKGAVAQGWDKLDDAHSTGFENGKLTNKFPAKLTLDGEVVDTNTDMVKVMKRGKERFHIACSHCHGELGDGNGMITQRGFVLKRKPANYHTDRLRKMPVGHFFDVMTHGYGIMLSQASRVEPDDRWAIVAYIRALQASQHIKEFSPEDKKLMEEAAEKAEPTEEAHH